MLTVAAASNTAVVDCVVRSVGQSESHTGWAMCGCSDSNRGSFDSDDAPLEDGRRILIHTPVSFTTTTMPSRTRTSPLLPVSTRSARDARTASGRSHESHWPKRDDQGIRARAASPERFAAGRKTSTVGGGGDGREVERDGTREAWGAEAIRVVKAWVSGLMSIATGSRSSVCGQTT